MRFIYSQNLYGIESVVLSGYTESQEHILIPMQYINGIWECNYEVKDRTFRYRFIINNDLIKMNDPRANYYLIDCYSEVWSIYDRLMKNRKSPIRLNRMIISDRVLNDFSRIKQKKVLNMRDNIKVVACLDITKIIGIHIVSVIWHQPDGRIYRIEERTLNVPLETGFVNASVSFWMNFNNMPPKYSKGIWEIEIYIDGQRITKDNFILGEKIREEYIGFLATI